jgi:hypothetical protein
MDIYDELRKLLQRLERDRVPYALCGGLALAVYGIVRATEDIDLLVEEPILPRLRALAEVLGFRFDPKPLVLRGDQITIYRLFKISGEDVLLLDLLLVTDLTRTAWATRQPLETAFGPVHVVSPGGLIELKTLRRSGQDEDDIRKLKELPNAT